MLNVEECSKLSTWSLKFADTIKNKGGRGVGVGAVIGYFGIATSQLWLAAHKLKFQTLLLLEI